MTGLAVPALLRASHIKPWVDCVTDAERTSCSTTIAAGLLKEGDFKGDSAEVTWHVEHPQELDPGVGWPWFRDLRMNLHGFQIDDIENSGLACNQLDDDALIEGLVPEGEMTVRRCGRPRLRSPIRRCSGVQVLGEFVAHVRDQRRQSRVRDGTRRRLGDPLPANIA